ncbi:MAG: MltA domain-containing protein, partial [Comamonadaceae bacterium]|nr:MltA domain-containing protein [Comamonadaceae bacterium]
MTASLLLRVSMALIVGSLVACSTGPRAPQPGPSSPGGPDTGFPTGEVIDTAPLGPPSYRPKSRWLPVRWAELPGFDADALHEAWNAWLRNCERPHAALAHLCDDVRRLSIASIEEQRHWLQTHWQPYRIESLDGKSQGMLTSYYEPEMVGSRVRTDVFNIPLYRVPAGFGVRKPWYTRQQIETLPEAQAALAGREIAWLSDPIEALVLHIQGSGRLRVTEPDGSERMIRLAYAGTNDQPYKSVGRWLLDRKLITDASWPGISAWIAVNPQRVQEMLWSNPRYVFFKEEPLDGLDTQFGPRGAQGVPLTPGRSIAVDRSSIPYGTPVWMYSKGIEVEYQRLVMAQDTGSAIVGAVRADYFMGWGKEAGDL